MQGQRILPLASRICPYSGTLHTSQILHISLPGPGVPSDKDLGIQCSMVSSSGSCLGCCHERLHKKVTVIPQHFTEDGSIFKWGSGAMNLASLRWWLHGWPFSKVSLLCIGSYFGIRLLELATFHTASLFLLLET